jgi:hypothetical protein
VERLPLELQVRFANLMERYMDQVSRPYFHPQIAVGNPFQLAFQASAPFHRLKRGQLDFLTYHFLEIAGFGKPPFDAGRTYLKRVGIVRNQVFLVQQLAQPFGDQLTVAMSHSAWLIYVNPDEAAFARSADLHFGDFDLRTNGDTFTQGGDLVRQTRIFGRWHLFYCSGK